MYRSTNESKMAIFCKNVKKMALSSQSIGVLLVNLGTPAAPTPKGVWSYLSEFLSDRRVVEWPAWLWFFVLRVLLLFLVRGCVARYRQIWTAGGSPLRTITAAQTREVQARFVHDGCEEIVVQYAMRYGTPSIHHVIHHLLQAGIKKFIFVPLYPQYASSTTGSVIEEVLRVLSPLRYIPEFRIIHHFHCHVAYIAPLADMVRRKMQEHQPQVVVFSFHGLPEKMILHGDPYRFFCEETVRCIVEELQLSKEQYLLSFQSRFGPAPWIRPYTQDTVIECAHQGLTNIMLVCPGFLADCIETLEELDEGVKNDFLQAGGQKFVRVACLNTEDQWMDGLAGLIRENIAGW